MGKILSCEREKRKIRSGWVDCSTFVGVLEKLLKKKIRPE